MPQPLMLITSCCHQESECPSKQLQQSREECHFFFFFLVRPVSGTQPQQESQWNAAETKSEVARDALVRVLGGSFMNL